MPLPAPAPRRHLHTRDVSYTGFLREDGLWDIEGRMADTKTYDIHMSERGDMPPGTPVHGMSVRVTIDDAMKIHAIAAAMDHTPFSECLRGEDPMQGMVGQSMGPGWRHTIERVLGGVQGCTHLRELLFNLATAAYQTVFPYREQEQRACGAASTPRAEPPYHLGRCIAWRFDGPVVERHYPQFAGWQPMQRAGKLGG